MSSDFGFFYISETFHSSSRCWAQKIWKFVKNKKNLLVCEKSHQKSLLRFLRFLGFASLRVLMQKTLNEANPRKRKNLKSDFW